MIIKDPSGKVMSNHSGQRWPGECFQPFQENFSARSYSRIREQEFIGRTLQNNKVESANHQTLLMKGPVSDKTPKRSEWLDITLPLGSLIHGSITSFFSAEFFGDMR